MIYCWGVLGTLLLLDIILLCVGAAFFAMIDMATLQFCYCGHDEKFYCRVPNQIRPGYAGACQPTQGYYYACTNDFNGMAVYKYPAATQLTRFDCYGDRHDTGFILLIAAAGIFSVCSIIAVWIYKRRQRKLRVQRLQEQQVQNRQLQAQQVRERQARQEQQVRERQLEEAHRWLQEQQVQELQVRLEQQVQARLEQQEQERQARQEQQVQQTTPNVQNGQQLSKRLPFLSHPAPAYSSNPKVEDPNNLKVEVECGLCFEVMTVGYVCHQCTHLCYCYECQKKTTGMRASCPFCNEPFPAIAVVISLA